MVWSAWRLSDRRFSANLLIDCGCIYSWRPHGKVTQAAKRREAQVRPERQRDADARLDHPQDGGIGRGRVERQEAKALETKTRFRFEVIAFVQFGGGSGRNNCVILRPFNSAIFSRSSYMDAQVRATPTSTQMCSTNFLRPHWLESHW